MFTPKPMRQVSLIVLEKDIPAVTRTIARLGMLHLLDVSELSDKLPLAHADRHELIRTYAALQRNVQTLRDALAPAAPLPATTLTAVEAAPAATPEELHDRVRQAQEEIQPVVERVAAMDKETEYLEPLIDQLELFGPLDIALEDLRSLHYLYLAVGALPAANLARLRTSLYQVPHVIVPFREDERSVAVFIFGPRDQSNLLERALRSAYFRPFVLPVQFSGPLEEALESVRQRATQLSREKQELHAQLVELHERWSRQLEALDRRVYVERALAEAIQHFGRTAHVGLIAGWIPADTLPHFTAAVSQVTGGRMVVRADRPQPLHREERIIPTALSNPRLWRAFERITNIYGRPSYGELDPTPLVALTFFLMFGMMFGDMGHGLLVILAGALILAPMSAMPWRKSFQGFAPILIACGLSSMIFGLLYGNLFGVEGILPSLWLKPLHDILKLLITSVAFGVVVLNISFLFNMINAFRRRDWQGLLLASNGLAGFLLYWAILLFVLSFAHAVKIPALLLAVVAVVAIMAIALAEPLGHLMRGHRPSFPGGLSSYMVQTFFELFEGVVAFLSNSLSYVRLGAFAVAHAGLTSIVFVLAGLVKGIPPLQWLVIGGGTLAVVAFEGLIVGIQTLRLEYYEFFNRFFHGTGVPYQPLYLPEA